MSTLRRLLARLTGVFQRHALDTDFEEELHAHLEIAEAELVERGLSPDEARRRARIELGGLAQLKEAGREARGIPGLDGLWLDLKLGLRRLKKSWGLTLIGGLAMTVAIALGTVVFAFFDTAFWPTLPLPAGERVVAIQTWDVREGRREPTLVEDAERWRSALRSVEEIGAFRTVRRRVEHGEWSEMSWLAEMTANGFELAGVEPALGRTLQPHDEQPGADPVAVLGWGLWESRFGSDPEVVGTAMEIGGVGHIVVGVLPDGFGFPVNHSLWVALRLSSDELLPAGPYGSTFARLSPGVTLDGLQAELATLGLRREGAPDQEFEARAMPYTFAFTDDLDYEATNWALRVILALLVLLLVPPCSNLAILVYAQIAARRDEFAARYALGAGRGRIVVQLFLETLLLASMASAAALLVARWTLRQLELLLASALGGRPPFWMDFTLSLETVVFAALLGFVAAAIAGLWPALQATGSRMRLGSRLLGSRSAARLGGTWTVLVVAQVALSMAVLPATVEMCWGTVRTGLLGPGFEADRFLTARLEAPEAEVGRALANTGDLGDWLRAVRAEPGVLEVTVGEAAPGREDWRRFEIQQDGGGGAFVGTRSNRIDADFAGAFDLRLQTGRFFTAAEFTGPERVALVDRTFVEQHFDGDSPLGHRLRSSPAGAEPGPWLEIVGVIGDVPQHVGAGTVYRPLPARATLEPSVTLRLEVGEDAERTAARLRSRTASLLPSHTLVDVDTLDAVYRRERLGNNLGAFLLGLAAVVVLLLSAAGMSALTSFTVQQRRHEIGVRGALGGQRGRLLVGVFRKAALQLGSGAAIGALLASAVDRILPIEAAGGWNLPFIVPSAALFLVCVGVVSALGPARHALRLEPVEVLREG